MLDHLQRNASPAVHHRILRPGDTCWRLEQAERFAVIVDAADYFALAKEAMGLARHSIFLIGWDFDLRIALTAAQGSESNGDRLGSFLNQIVNRQPNLHIYILKWDMAVLFTMRTHSLKSLFFDLVGTGRVHLRFDSTHPTGAAHHQKIVVIDDAIAFCGGIDMTDNRWDTRSHRPDDQRRVNPDGERYGAWHDSTAVVDGEAAKALGELVRERWFFATGKRIATPPERIPAWPARLKPQLENVDVAIARTMPRYGGRAQIHEIENLCIAAIRSARRFIYIESQYFASARIGEVLQERLRDESGPEVVVVNPESAKGWLEEIAMDSARRMMLDRVRGADRHGRFRLYCPVNAAGQPIYVHSKVLIVDDRLIRVGSSNIDNRSMGFDSECDLAVEAGEAEQVTSRGIAALRNDLLAEHLDVTADEIASALQTHGGLIAAIESLRKPVCRSLRNLDLPPLDDSERTLVESRIADPERPGQAESRLAHIAKRLALRRPGRVLAGVGALLGFAILWTSR